MKTSTRQNEELQLPSTTPKRTRILRCFHVCGSELPVGLASHSHILNVLSSKRSVTRFIWIGYFDKNMINIGDPPVSTAGFHKRSKPQQRQCINGRQHARRSARLSTSTPAYTSMELTVIGYPILLSHKREVANLPGSHIRLRYYVGPHSNFNDVLSVDNVADCWIVWPRRRASQDGWWSASSQHDHITCIHTTILCLSSTPSDCVIRAALIQHKWNRRGRMTICWHVSIT